MPAADAGKVRISREALEMLEQDLEGELDATARHRERIALAELLQEYGPRRALDAILLEEEEHASDLHGALDH